MAFGIEDFLELGADLEIVWAALHLTADESKAERSDGGAGLHSQLMVALGHPSACRIPCHCLQIAIF